MCEAKPRPRCAADACAAVISTEKAYTETFPDGPAVDTLTAGEVQIWYHTGNPDFWQHGQYAHIGTKGAAMDRRDVYNTRALYEVIIAPKRPVGSPSRPITDKQANTLDLWNQRHPGRVPESPEEGLAFDLESASSGAYGLHVYDVVQETGWTPDTDAIYYSNFVEDKGSVSVVVKAGAVAATRELLGEQQPLWGTNDQYARLPARDENG